MKYQVNSLRSGIRSSLEYMRLVIQKKTLLIWHRQAPFSSAQAIMATTGISGVAPVHGFHSMPQLFEKSDWLRSMAAQSGTQGTFKMLQAGGSTAQCKAALKLSASSLVIRVANCPPTNFNTLHTAKGIKNESLYKTVRLFG